MSFVPERDAFQAYEWEPSLIFTSSFRVSVPCPLPDGFFRWISFPLNVGMVGGANDRTFHFYLGTQTLLSNAPGPFFRLLIPVAAPPSPTEEVFLTSRLRINSTYSPSPVRRFSHWPTCGLNSRFSLLTGKPPTTPPGHCRTARPDFSSGAFPSSGFPLFLAPIPCKYAPPLRKRLGTTGVFLSLADSVFRSERKNTFFPIQALPSLLPIRCREVRLRSHLSFYPVSKQKTPPHGFYLLLSR